MKADPKVIARAKHLLDGARKAPAAFASTREAFMTMITAILQMADVNFVVHWFWKKHLEAVGNVFATTSNPVTDDWAHTVIDDALYELSLKETFPLEKDKYEDD